MNIINKENNNILNPENFWILDYLYVPCSCVINGKELNNIKIKTFGCSDIMVGSYNNIYIGSSCKLIVGNYCDIYISCFYFPILKEFKCGLNCKIFLYNNSAEFLTKNLFVKKEALLNLTSNNSWLRTQALMLFYNCELELVNNAKG
jgi:hypothetical protein